MTQMMKEGNVFFYCDEHGNLVDQMNKGFGMYTQDTRFLSHLDWSLEGIPTVLLMSHVEGAESVYRYTNQQVEKQGQTLLWRESLEIIRKRWIYKEVVYETFSLKNLDQRPIQSFMVFRFDADFADMFVVRGYLDGQLGEKKATQVRGDGLLFSYLGSDGVKRYTEIQIHSKELIATQTGEVKIPLSLKPGEQTEIQLKLIPFIQQQKPQIFSHDDSLIYLQQSYQHWFATCPQIESDSTHLNEMFQTSLLDFKMLLTDIGEGEFPVAGLPWFAVPFGRDSIIAALQAISIRPEIAKATIRTMSKYQGEKVDHWRDEEPGKILHEIRYGELANSNQIPFTPYYGTVDATPLFLILIGELYRWTGDLSFVRQWTDHAIRAFEWIDTYGDPVQTGYTSYLRQSEKGISNQGWKDSGNSIVHRNGELAQAPIALSEVQGYVYMARQTWSHLFRLIGEEERANRLAEQANELRNRFVHDFWMEDEEFVALALDEQLRQVGVVTSNPGQCLMTGILSADQATKVAKRLLERDLFSGWGIRTMSSQEKAYNPMSYHNGSIWPHDNSLILLGLSKMGFHQEAEKLMKGLIDLASEFEHHRLPELVCGYGRDEERLVSYPVACSPQAWAAGTAFILLQTMLGISPNPEQKRITLQPSLPEGVNQLHVQHLPVADGFLDIHLVKVDGRIHTSITRNTTSWSVVLVLS